MINCVREEVLSKIKRLESLLDSKLKIAEVVTLINNEKIPEKRRKLSQIKEAEKQYAGRLELCNCLANFYDINSNFVTEKMLKTLLLVSR